jgi:hypothetical protein
MGLQQHFAWQWAFNKILPANGPSAKRCSATGLQQNFDWQWAFNKILPGNGPSTKF